jgi:hypothetical protein
MRLFAVRLIKDKQAVGFFWAPDPITLWQMIDSVCDPSECECRPIKDRAAITWQGQIKATLGGGNGQQDEEGKSSALDELRRELCFDYALEDYVMGEVNTEWKKCRLPTSQGIGSYDVFLKTSQTDLSVKQRKTKQPIHCDLNSPDKPSLLLIALIIERVFLGVFDRLRVDQFRGLLVGFPSVRVLVALLGLLDGADHEIGQIFDRFADLGGGNACFIRSGETLIGKRLGPCVNVDAGIFGTDMARYPFLDKGQRAFAHFRLLIFTSSLPDLIRQSMRRNGVPYSNGFAAERQHGCPA